MILTTQMFQTMTASTLSRFNALTRFFVAGIIALAVAIADEIHQSFIPTRDASILDVFLDFVGIALVLFLFSRLYKKRIDVLNGINDPNG